MEQADHDEHTKCDERFRAHHPARRKRGCDNAAGGEGEEETSDTEPSRHGRLPSIVRAIRTGPGSHDLLPVGQMEKKARLVSLASIAPQSITPPPD
jgi:hypothetical protein